MSEQKEDLQHFFQTHYGKTGAREHFLAGTQSSNVSFVTFPDGVRYVVKGSSWYNFASQPTRALETAYEVSDLLIRNGVPIVPTVRGSDGLFVHSFRGLPTAVMEFCEGIPFSGDVIQAAAAGRALAIFHATGKRLLAENSGLSEKITVSIPVEKTYEDSRELYIRGNLKQTILSEHVCSNPIVCAAVGKNIAMLEEMMSEIDETFSSSAFFGSGLVHNDFNHDNGLYKVDGSFSAFIDIDQLGIGLHVWDVGNTLLSFSSKCPKNDGGVVFKKCTGAFLRAYHRINPLLVPEYRAIPAAAARWDVMRILRTLRRHHFEGDRLLGLMMKLEQRLLPRLAVLNTTFSFLSESWIEEVLK
jgi:Ser/Thr protein kinase RdoA (MazF antagonist)